MLKDSAFLHTLHLRLHQNILSKGFVFKFKSSSDSYLRGAFDLSLQTISYPQESSKVSVPLTAQCHFLYLISNAGAV